MKHIRPALALTALFLVITLVFPMVIYAFGQIPGLNFQANGSLLYDKNGKLVGSLLIAQGFTKPQYFHPRPSGAGNGYDPMSSGGTNLGATSDKLINGIHQAAPNDKNNFDGIKDLAVAYRKENGLSADQVLPSDAVTRSGSGLDPDISVENALLQSGRVAQARGVAVETLKPLIDEATSKPFLGIYGETTVNVLKLNQLLDRLGAK